MLPIFQVEISADGRTDHSDLEDIMKLKVL